MTGLLWETSLLDPDEVHSSSIESSFRIIFLNSSFSYDFIS